MTRYAMVLVALITIPRWVDAATITYVGADFTTEDAWRTSSVTKTLDIDGDNIYGTDGYFLFSTVTGGVFSGDAFANIADATPGWTGVVNDGANFSVNFPGLSDIDDPGNVPTDRDSGSLGVGFGAVPSQGAEVSTVNLTFSGSIPAAGVRIGVLANNSDGENPSAIRFELDGSGGSVTASAPITPDNGLNSPAQWFFFDFTGIQSGDTFSLYATDALGGGQEIKGIGGFTYDVIPEPGTLSLLGIAAAALAVTRRRKR